MLQKRGEGTSKIANMSSEAVTTTGHSPALAEKPQILNSLATVQSWDKRAEESGAMLQNQSSDQRSN